MEFYILNTPMVSYPTSSPGSIKHLLWSMFSIIIFGNELSIVGKISFRVFKGVALSRGQKKTGALAFICSYFSDF